MFNKIKKNKTVTTLAVALTASFLLSIKILFDTYNTYAFWGALLLCSSVVLTLLDLLLSALNADKQEVASTINKWILAASGVNTAITSHYYLYSQSASINGLTASIIEIANNRFSLFIYEKAIIIGALFFFLSSCRFFKDSKLCDILLATLLFAVTCYSGIATGS